jgi:hypothetical protein
VQGRRYPQKDKTHLKSKNKASTEGECQVKKQENLYTQDLVPIKDIAYGLIMTTDNRYLKILEIEPINFMLRNADEQENIIQNFAGWLKVCPAKMQFKIVTRSADAMKYVDNLMEMLKNEKNANCRELGKHYMNLIKTVGSQAAVTRRFFIILEYEPYNEMYKLTEPKEIAVEMQKIAEKTKGFFNNIGNEIVSPENENVFLAEILYMFYNRKSCATESFFERVDRVASDTKKIHGLRENDPLPYLPMVNLIAPRGIDFSDPEYIIIDGMYHSHLYMESKGYPTQVMGGWLSPLVTLGEGVDIDIFVSKQSRSAFVNKVSRKVRLNRIKMKERDDTQSDYEEIAGSIQSGLYIKKAISQGNEDPFYINLFITVTAETKEQLMWRKRQVMDYITAQDMKVEDCLYEEEKAFQTVAPFLKIDKNLYRKSKRNAMTQGVASCYCFTAYEMCDDGGTMLGVNKHNSSLCVVDQFDTKKYKNANMAILGTSGAGKTFTELLMGLRMRMMDIQCFILAPDKAHEFKRACDAIGGSYIKISPSSADSINIMDIKPSVSPVKELLDGYTFESETWLSKKVQQLIIFFQLLIEDLTNEEEQLLDEAIIKTYEKKGITHDNDSLYIDVNDKTKGLKEMPIIGDLQEILLEDNSRIPQRIPNILSKFVTGSARAFNRHTNVDLDNKFLVFDLEDLKGRLLPAGMFLALDFVWDKVKEDRTKKKAIFIDEAWQLIGAGSNIKAAEFVHHIFKVIRGYGGGAILATQDIRDLFSLEDGKYGSAILSCSKIKMVLQLEEDEAEKVKELLKLTRKEIRDIVNYERGEALICANNNHVPVAVIASEFETELITTDRKMMKDILDRKQSRVTN